MTTAEGAESGNLLLKVLNADGTPCHGGHGAWAAEGEWMPPIEGELAPCSNGYHLTDLPGFLSTWAGPAVWLAEYDGDHIDDGDKRVVRRARLVRRLTWDQRTARHYACDCAERVLPIYEQSHPGDDRPRRCVAIARRFADGEATADELSAAWAAAGAAAWAAAGDAAWAAAGAAAWAAASAAAWDAAWDAARAAAWDAARAAARAAAWAAAGGAEQRWQLSHLADVLGLTDDGRAAVWPEGGAS